MRSVVREWRDGNARAPLLCLPGIVRTSGDFETFCARRSAPDGAWWRSTMPVAANRAGRATSRDMRPEACLRDVLDICAALHLHRAIAIGTSFGGLLGMGLAAARPSLFRAVVLNDIGPEIGSSGTGFVRRFIGHDAAFPDIDAAVAHLRAVLPPLSLDGDEAWRTMAALTYAPDADGALAAGVGHAHRAADERQDARSVAVVRRAGASALAAGAWRRERHPAAGDGGAHAGAAARHGSWRRCPASATRRP